MPHRPNVPCKHPGCARLVPYGRAYCDEHAQAHRGDGRTTTEKGYTRRWQQARDRFLKTHPLCVRCQAAGKLTPATVVDHVLPHRGDQHLFWDQNNWQALCKPCHDRKTMTEDRLFEYKR